MVHINPKTAMARESGEQEIELEMRARSDLRKASCEPVIAVAIEVLSSAPERLMHSGTITRRNANSPNSARVSTCRKIIDATKWAPDTLMGPLAEMP
jgi:hypothetical protein